MYTKIIIATVLILFTCLTLHAQSSLQLASGGKIEADNSIGIFLNRSNYISSEEFAVYHCSPSNETNSRALPEAAKLFELSGSFAHNMWGEFQLHGDFILNTNYQMTSGGIFNSPGSFIFNLDNNDNASNESFLIRNSDNTNVFRVREDGEGFSKNFTTQGDLTIEDSIFSDKGILLTPEGFSFVLDDDNSTIFGPIFTIRDGNTSMFSIGGFGAAQMHRSLKITGDLEVTGSISKGGGTFRIDHPLDPKNKYLYHSFIESPDMMNIYNGNAKTDDDGFATIALPEYFEALNIDFRYQLTVIETFADAIVSSKISDNCFTIQTTKPNVEVSWQVTGIRNDDWAKENRVQVEVYKDK